jgi:hypothetical protein
VVRPFGQLDLYSRLIHSRASVQMGPMKPFRIYFGRQVVRVFLSRAWRAERNKPKHILNREKLELALQTALAQSRGRSSSRRSRYQHSVSHSPKAGGFALSTQAVGLDIESRDRQLSDKAFARVGDVHERSLVRQPIHLWVMKEAAWKALRGEDQPKTIFEIQITKVLRKKRGRLLVFEFCLNGANAQMNSTNAPLKTLRGSGQVILRSGLVLAVALGDGLPSH